jgi:S1-C subfamily serine protease
MSVLNEIVETGRVTRGWLGVELSSTPDPGMAVGLEVTRVLERGPADRAGLEIGDRILAINDQPAVSSAVVSRHIAAASPGSPIQLDVLRGDEQVRITALSGERPAPN